MAIRMTIGEIIIDMTTSGVEIETTSGTMIETTIDGIMTTTAIRDIATEIE
ncbi:MAG: hypothetical protein JOZ78_11380 [Chroococcidiopsidaceae cyanobacterium CP_BM_ER_R8_30]|nr:hypothetical protein [Chroococcidiopsidaceae cyanobacterium CP_BM_ER_R8_30]